MKKCQYNLLDLNLNQKGVIDDILAYNSIKERLHHLGLIKGVDIKLMRIVPGGSPRIYSYLHTEIAIRNNLAKKIKICLFKKSE